MTEKSKTHGTGVETLRAARRFTRRTVLKGATAGAVVALGPFVIGREALSSSGEVNVYAWSDYIWPEHTESFENKTGIKVNLSKYGSNDEVLTKLKASKGTGFDLVFPSVNYGPAW